MIIREMCVEFCCFFVDQVLLIYCEEQFLGTLKSPKLKYLENHLFKKNSEHRFEDYIRTNKLDQFFFSKNFFQRLGTFFVTIKPLIWGSFFSTKNNFVVFFKWLFDFNIKLNRCFKNLFRKAVKNCWFF